MPEHASTFRDFGVLPQSLQPPSGRFNAIYPGGRILGQYLATVLVGLGLELAKANPGYPLSSAWSIEELNEPLSAARVTEILRGSAGCFAAVFLFLIPVWNSRLLGRDT